jgi:hypothetical protein
MGDTTLEEEIQVALTVMADEKRAIPERYREN